LVGSLHGALAVLHVRRPLRSSRLPCGGRDRGRFPRPRGRRDRRGDGRGRPPLRRPRRAARARASGARAMSAESLTVTLADVEAARLRIAGYVHRTPVLTSRILDPLLDASLFFKCETFQRVGAFKAQGAFSRLTLLSEEEKTRGVV